MANYCWDIVEKTIGKNNISEIIEPSAGNGAFFHHKNFFPHFSYDIAPQCEGIIQSNYLELNIRYLSGRLIIGNPPYGRCLNMAQKFYKKSINIADYIAFILPISQFNNTQSMYEFDLIYSEDIGINTYTDKKLHCCFNIYKRPESGEYNTKPKIKLKDISIYRQDSNGYDKKDFDLRMCYWGDGTAGKILKNEEHYSAEYKIKINNINIKNKVINTITNFNWKEYLNCIAMRKIQQFHIIDILKNAIPEIE